MTRPSVLLLAQRADVGAMAIASLLRRRAVCDVTLVDEFAFSRHAMFHAPESGRAGAAPSGRPRLHDGMAERALERGTEHALDRPYDVILCRAATFRSKSFRQPSDAEYAAAETHAFALSWLWSRREVVVNPPTPACLSGVALDVLGVARACATVGLSTPAVLLATDAARVDRARTARAQRRSWIDGVPGDLDAGPVDMGPPLAAPALWVEELLPERRSVLVCTDILIDAPPALADRLRELATSIGLPVAEIRLARSAHRPDVVVVGVSPAPVLSSTAHLQAIAADLERRAAEHSDRAAA
jgi:hypothetical protein